MKKLFSFCSSFLSLCTLTFLPHCFVSCAKKDEKQQQIIEPTSKTFYSNTQYESGKLLTNCFIGMFFLKEIDNPSLITVKANELDGSDFLGDLNASFIKYDDNIYFIDLTIGNINCFAGNYDISLSFYLQDQLIQKPSIYNIVVSTQIIQINNEIITKPTWNSESQTVNYILKSNIAKIIHPAKTLMPSDFDVEIKFLSPDIKNAVVSKRFITNTNELGVNIDLDADNLLGDSTTYYINLEITYLPSKTTKYFYYNLLFEKDGWDNLVKTSAKMVSVKRPIDSSFIAYGYIRNFVISGFNENQIPAILINTETSSEVQINAYFVKRISTSLPIYDLQIEVTNVTEIINSLPLQIKVSNSEIIFYRDYYLTVTEE